MYNDQLNGLLALKTVAETRNFTAAAKALRVSPSAVSQTIRQLEGRLGVALLSRTTRSTSLTEAGELFLNQVGPALDQILVAVESAGSYAKKPSGLLRINLPRQVYVSHLAPLVASFTREHPEITIELFFEDGQSDVVAEGFDAGIRLSDILARDVVAIKLLGPVRFVTAASPGYLDAMGRPEHPQALLSHNCIRPRLGEGIYERWEFEDNGTELQVQVKGSLIINDSLLMVEAAEDGAGIVYSSEEAVRDKVRSGKLEIVLDEFACTSAGFYLYYPKRSQVLPKLRAFIDHIKGKNRSAAV
ncbi:MAG: LysR family transcriptional regulator [Rhodospirillales bacterium]|nr:LysR family transcriptional regulator [Rhodospirillales bacterium]